MAAFVVSPHSPAPQFFPQFRVRVLRKALGDPECIVRHIVEGVDTSGTWFVIATVTVTGPAGAALFSAKLWDGTTVIALLNRRRQRRSSRSQSITLSGVITSPAGNLKVSVRDASSASGFLLFNQTGSSKDCVTVRIAP